MSTHCIIKSNRVPFHTVYRATSKGKLLNTKMGGVHGTMTGAEYLKLFGGHVITYRTSNYSVVSMDTIQSK